MRSIQFLVKALRKFRSLHRYIGTGLAAFMLMISVTGLMLGWKKNVAMLQPPAQKGVTDNFSGWKTFEAIALEAQRALDSAQNLSSGIDRFDARPDKGIVKVLFKEGYWEAQVDGKTGKVLSVAQRHSDWIEHIHDGSIISDAFKLVYTNVTSIGLFILALSGLWLWYGPKVIRKSK